MADCYGFFQVSTRAISHLLPACITFKQYDLWLTNMYRIMVLRCRLLFCVLCAVLTLGLGWIIVWV